MNRGAVISFGGLFFCFLLHNLLSSVFTAFFVHLSALKKTFSMPIIKTDPDLVQEYPSIPVYIQHPGGGGL